MLDFSVQGPKFRKNDVENLLFNSLYVNFEKADWYFNGNKFDKKNLSSISSDVSDIVYYLTPKGFSEKTKITLRFMKLKMQEYEELKNELKKFKLLNQGIFAGFVYIIGIMVILGILMVPGSITAAIGGFFGGRKSGDPARALTAAMLPFLEVCGALCLCFYFFEKHF